MSVIDRLAAELDKLGKKAGQALDQGKLRVELMRVRRRMDNAARDLGYLTYRQAQGATAPEVEVQAIVKKIAEAEAEAARLEEEIRNTRSKGTGATGAAAGQPSTEPSPSDAGRDAAPPDRPTA